jgi:hypothetical protein
VAFSAKERKPGDEPATHGTEGNAAAPVMYMALELSNKTWQEGSPRRGGNEPHLIGPLRDDEFGSHAGSEPGGGTSPKTLTNPDFC